MEDILTSYERSSVTIDFQGSSLNMDTFKERVQEVVPLLQALLKADTALSVLSNEELSERGIGFRAIDMICQATIQSAVVQAELLHDIADGSASIADHGFPEFVDGKNLDV